MSFRLPRLHSAKQYVQYVYLPVKKVRIKAFRQQELLGELLAYEIL